MVYDCILKGLSQPVLGVFSINISDFIKKNRERNGRKLRKASKALLDKTLGIGNLDLFLKKQSAPQQVGEGDNILLRTDESLPEKPVTGQKPGLFGLGLGGATGPKLGMLGQLGAKTEEKKEEEEKSVNFPEPAQTEAKGGYAGLREEKPIFLDLEKKDPVSISMQVKVL